MKKIKGLLIKRDGLNLIIKEEIIPNELCYLQKIISSQTIDIITRKINNKKFCFIIDDNGRLLFKERICISYFEDLVGDVFIVGQANSNGDLTSLKDSDIDLIKSSIVVVDGFKCIRYSI